MVPMTLYVVFTREFRRIARYPRAYGLSPVLSGTENVAGMWQELVSPKRVVTETDLK